MHASLYAAPSKLHDYLNVHIYALYYVGLHGITLDCIALDCIALDWIALRCIALYCVVLRCVAHSIIGQTTEEDCPASGTS